MKVITLAGTLVDTKMGGDVLREVGIEALEYPLSRTPKEQTKLQYFKQEELEDLVREKIKLGMAEGGEKVFIYCNSLSGAIDYEKIGKELDIEIVTPLETYKNLKGVKNVAIIAANGSSAYNIEKIINEADDSINTLTFGNLELVNLIEEALEPKEIIERLNIDGLLKYLENKTDERYKTDTFLLGCTHFPYIKEELEKITDLRIIDPKDDMIKRLGI